MDISKIVIAVIATLAFLYFTLFGVVHQDAQEVLVTQSPFGTMEVHTSPGWHFLPLSKTTFYPRRESYEFTAKIVFSDGAESSMTGSVQFEVPLEKATLLELHSKYGSSDALTKDLVSKAVDKAIFLSGPFMTSRESYAEKRGYLISLIEDQINNGMYLTRQYDAMETDQLTGSVKTITKTEILKDDKGLPKRELSVLAPFGVKTFNFTAKEITYAAAVKTQVAAQQKIIMDVQTAIADAKKAEQQVITTSKQGEAEAAKAKWEQEVFKAKAVTQAQQELEVAQLATKKAEQEKLALILKAEGESEYKRKIIAADNALAQRLEAVVKIHELWANAFSNYKGNLVPSTVMGGSSQNGATNVQSFMDLMVAKTAKDLAVDIEVK